jgi:ribosome-associated protein
MWTARSAAGLLRLQRAELRPQLQRGRNRILWANMRPDPNETNLDEASDAADVSRSQRRREALDVLRLAQTLSEMSDAQLQSIPLEDDLRDEVRRTRAVHQQIARKRQNQYLAKQMRKLDDAALDAIRAALEHDRDLSRRETAALHQVETWRERLMAEGDDALTDLLTAHPHGDRQHLRQLARQARSERAAGKPPHAYRELFRSLRDLLAAAPDGSSE